MRRFVTASLVLTLVAGVVPVAASTFLALSLEELVDRADAVVQGRVTNLESGWTTSGRLIFTDATVRVDDVLAGSARGEVRVRTFGGTVGDFTVDAHGFPRFERGERVILFLRRDDGDGTLRVVGYQQGHWRVVTRLDHVTLAVPMVDEGVRLLTADGLPAGLADSVDLGRFHQDIRRIKRRRRR